MENYGFDKCKDLNEVKQLFKQLAKKFHPDCGGDTATMQKINSLYQFWTAKILSGGGFTESEINNELNLSAEYQEKINSICHFDGLIIELVGNWIWVTGNTFVHRAELKKNGFYFASKKQAWYYRNDDYNCAGSKGKPLDEIRSKYGAQNVGKSHSRYAIA